MAQEENPNKCSNSSSGGGGGSGGGSNSRSSKKMKAKKVPQRGLGVAQLEKIRIEEEQKKDAALQAAGIISPNPIISPSNSSSCLAVQCPTFRHSFSLSSIPLPPPSPTDFPPQNSVFRSAPPVQNIDLPHPNPLPISKPSSVKGNDNGWSAISSPGQGKWSKWSNGEYSVEGDNQGSDHQGLIFKSTVNFHDESNTPVLPTSRKVQISQQFQQPASSSMVNVSLGKSSSVLSFQMEPPSNQNYYGSSYMTLYPEELKIVGVKRPYPFSMENPPGPPFRCKFPSSFAAPVSKSDESVSCSNGQTVNSESGHAVIRECPSSSFALSESNTKKVTKENGGFVGDFLTLAPPTAALPYVDSTHAESLSNNVLYTAETPEFQSLSSQASGEDGNQRSGPSGSYEERIFSFFPLAKVQTGQAAIAVSNCHGEVGEIVDLNLKL